MSRLFASWRLVAVLLGVCAGWWGGGAAAQAQLPRGTTFGPPPSVAHAERVLGANVDPARFGESMRAEAHAIGIRWLRVTLSSLDAAPSADWLNRVRADGFKLLLVLPLSPADIPAPAGTDTQYFHDWRAAGAAVRALATALRGRVDAYQIGDEPNLAARWNGAYPNPADYVALLREAAINIRAVEPTALIVSAALAPTTEDGPLNLNEPEFLRQMYRASAREFFDVLGAEPFGFWSGPDDRRVATNVLNFSRVLLQRDVMVANGDGDKAVWVTAFGWYVLGEGEFRYGGDSGDVQSKRTLDAIRRARDEWHWLGPLMFARWAAGGPADRLAAFALRAADGTPSPLLLALRARRDPPVATIGRFTPDDPSAAFPRSWRVSADGADPPQDDRTPVRIAFRGTRFDLALRRGLYEGVLFVNVDGSPANALPRDPQNRAYVVLFDPLGARAEVTLARDLPDGEHLLEIVPQGGWGRWAIAGWTVSREYDDSAWRWGGTLAGALLLWALTLPRTRRMARRALDGLSHFKAPTSIQQIAYPAALLCGAALYLSPQVALSWALIAVLFMLAYIRVEAGLALVALALPFYLQPKPLGAGVYSVVEIALLVSAAALLVQRLLAVRDWSPRALLAGWRAPRLSALDGVVVLWVIAGGVGVLAAENFGVANREFRVIFSESALYYLLLRASAAPPLPLVNAFLLGAGLLSARALADRFTGTNLITAEGVLRARGFYFSPNNLALYLDRAVPLALALAFFARTALAGWRRTAYGLALLLMLAALYLTFAKGAWLLAMPAAFLVMGALRGRRWLAAALLAIAGLGATLLPVLGTARLQSLLDLSGGTTIIRLQLWQAALAMLRDHWLLGVGPDNFLYLYRTRYILPTAFAEAQLSHPHNILLDFWTRLGLIGVCLLAVLLAAFWRAAWRRYRDLPDGSERALLLGWMGAMAASLAHGMIDNSFFLVDLSFALMLMLAALAEPRPPAPAPKSAREEFLPARMPPV